MWTISCHHVRDDFKLMKFLCYMGRIYGPGLSMHLGKKYDY
jgi:hypothetical protein